MNRQRYKVADLYFSDTDVLKNEIKDLKESLKLKSSQIILTEKIASLQLKEASNIIQHLYLINANQVRVLIIFLISYTLLSTNSTTYLIHRYVLPNN